MAKQLPLIPKILVVSPRLDVTFKEGPVPEYRSPLPPIREHWDRFVKNLLQYHKDMGHFVEHYEKPLWQVSVDYIKQRAKEFDRVYIPHKQKIDFNAGDNIYYYMQTVYPERFTIDSDGWGARLSYLPFDLKSIDVEEASNFYENFILPRLQNNESKFEQPSRKKFNYEGHTLFICQIPHDETIRYNSSISVIDALRKTYEYARTHDNFLIVKGHPANRSSMVELKGLTDNFFKAKYVDDVSIHDVISTAANIFLVNSGAGFEAIAHLKPVIRFGDSEYNQITPIYGNHLDFMFHTIDYQKFLYAFYNSCIDSRLLESYHKIIGKDFT